MPSPELPMTQVSATRTRRTKANAWMPQKCFVRLEGEASGGFLTVCGFSVEPDKPICGRARLEKYLGKIKQQWCEEYGAGWRLEICPAPK
jgi:hypothetical protein